jgi:hypothetical protein
MDNLADLPLGVPVEIWLQDEARIGQKNGLANQPTSAMKAPISSAPSARLAQNSPRAKLAASTRFSALANTRTSAPGSARCR